MKIETVSFEGEEYRIQPPFEVGDRTNTTLPVLITLAMWDDRIGEMAVEVREDIIQVQAKATDNVLSSFPGGKAGKIMVANAMLEDTGYTLSEKQ